MPYKDPEVRRAKHREYMKERWYPANKEKHIQMVHIARDRRRKRLTQLVKEMKLKCSQCGETHPATLQFHHNDPSSKEFELAHAIYDGASQERILAEIKKCTILCANCHCKIHHPNFL